MVRLWWNILVANLATNFQDLVAKVKNLVALVPVLGAISHPALYVYTQLVVIFMSEELLNFVVLIWS